MLNYTSSASTRELQFTIESTIKDVFTLRKNSACGTKQPLLVNIYLQ